MLAAQHFTGISLSRTGGGGRTHTLLRVLDFESSASASSATPAGEGYRFASDAPGAREITNNISGARASAASIPAGGRWRLCRAAEFGHRSPARQSLGLPKSAVAASLCEALSLT